MHQAIHAILEFNESAEGGDLGDLALDDLADVVGGGDGSPRIGLGLLEAEADALVGGIDLEDDGLDGLALLQHFGGVVDLARPGHIRDVDHAVDALFHLDEGAVGGEVADLAGDARAHRVAILDGVPRIGLGLADAQGDLLVGRIDVEDHHVHLVADVKHIGGAGNTLGPAELGDVHQALDAGLELDERAVRSQVDHLATQTRPDRVASLDVVPRIALRLLEAQGDTLALQVHIQDHHIELLADLEEFGRVLDAAPAHIGDVQQAIHAIQVHERTEVGDVLDLAVDNLPLLELGEQGVLLLGHLRFEQLAARDDDVATLVGDLDNLEVLRRVGDVNIQIARRIDIHLRAREESLHTIDGHNHAAADLALDDAGNRVAFLILREDRLPANLLIGLALGNHHHAVIPFEVDQQHIKRVAHVHRFHILELIGVDRPGRLAPDVHEHFIAALAGDLALHDRARRRNAVLLIQRGEQFVVESTGLLDRLLRFANSHLAFTFCYGRAPLGFPAGSAARWLSTRLFIIHSSHAGEVLKLYHTPPRQCKRAGDNRGRMTEDSCSLRS